MDTLTHETTSHFVETDRGRLHYNVAGDGPAVILLHGSGPGASGWSNFRPNIEPLAEHFRVYALDAPGWGESAPASPTTYDHPRAGLEFMDALGIAEAALVGNSMGGFTAVTFAARYPARITHLITMGTGCLLTMPTLFGAQDGPSEGLKILHEAYRDPSPETMSTLVDVMTFDSGERASNVAAERSRAALSHPEHLANYLEGAATGGPIRTAATLEQLRGITTPTLIIHGRDDRVVHYEQGLRLLSCIENSRLVVINRCGHWVQLEHADEFNRLVTGFVLHGHG